MGDDDQVSLREYIESRLKSMEEAKKIALEQMERRLEGMNEFREQLRDQAARLATKDEVYLRLGNVDMRIQSLELSRAKLVGAGAVAGAVTGAFAAMLVRMLGHG